MKENIFIAFLSVQEVYINAVRKICKSFLYFYITRDTCYWESELLWFLYPQTWIMHWWQRVNLSYTIFLWFIKISHTTSEFKLANSYFKYFLTKTQIRYSSIWWHIHKNSSNEKLGYIAVQKNKVFFFKNRLPLGLLSL